MKLTIEKVDNGYIVTNKSDENRKTVIQVSNFDNEVYSDAELLRVVNQLIGESTSKHSQHRVYVNVLPGENYDGPVDERMKSDMEFMSYLCPINIENE